MRAALPTIAACLLAACVHAEVAPVEVRIPENEAWVGQRMRVFIDLRTKGSFGGATDFSAPQIPGGFLMKVGSATVSSKEIGGETYFVQTHEFAFYSQRDGEVNIPSFEVRFGSREGFTGPVTDRKESVPATKVTIRRPPGTDAEAFLVTTDSYELTEQWDPKPGPAQQGAVFKRTIIQRAHNVPGMALPRGPDTVPDGWRIYPADVQTADKADRGDLRGERRETITYLAQQPGTVTLPALSFQWWNPQTQKLESKTLAAVTFEISPAPSAASPAEQSAARSRAWPWLLPTLALIVGSIWKRDLLTAWLAGLKHRLNPPDRVAARRLLRACRQSDAPAAFAAWTEWMSARPDDARAVSPELHDAQFALQRHLFGPSPASAWRPDVLATAFREHLRRKNICAAFSDTSLPPLNPVSPVTRSH